MSLLGQTAWVVGGVGVVGRGITRGLLQAGATVIVNSRSPERLEKLKDGLGDPNNLILVHGSLLPGYASKTVADALKNNNNNNISTTSSSSFLPPLNHVVAHGAVRWWARPTPGSFEFYEFKAGCDESYSLNIRANEKLLDMSPESFVQSSAQLASLHFSAAQALIPELQRTAASRTAGSGSGGSSGGNSTKSSYTFVTGDGSGKPGGDRTAMGEINSHHVWGLSAALRKEMQGSKDLSVREVRVRLPIANDDEEQQQLLLQSRLQSVSEDIGDLVAGLASMVEKDTADDGSSLIQLDEFQDLDTKLAEYNAGKADGRDLPHYYCYQGEMSGSL
eukprot:CAMPEP_0118700856 /NCGR_PEP_ID=MMETSP0800-20121206/16858_1 /TAXON_ID=210618 ORGANISM="Striatella unipunctata, Strain CCMP2910" /NCGR_SAMPLE_ID=MMETSP0800 /ASSEMBLY_ACC=CAM_ASM_000638 /LENGTH=333 /DNA_ID=CAMNT_0006601573 /DNA_START=114 /DNA_END=1115 /DNA_ORIENTATION=-